MTASMSEPIPENISPAGGSFSLRDGTTLYWRAIRPEDAPRLQAFHKRLSNQSLFFRFFGEMPVLGRDLAERLSRVDYDNRMAIVATAGTSADEPILAVARYERTDADAAEMALVVEDDWQGRGIGPRLLHVLATYASRHGYTTLIANVRYDNEHMLTLLRHSSLPSVHHLQEGRVEVRLDISGLNAPPLAE